MARGYCTFKKRHVEAALKAAFAAGAKTARVTVEGSKIVVVAELEPATAIDATRGNEWDQEG